MSSVLLPKIESTKSNSSLLFFSLIINLFWITLIVKIPNLSQPGTIFFVLLVTTLLAAIISNLGGVISIQYYLSRIKMKTKKAENGKYWVGEDANSIKKEPSFQALMDDFSSKLILGITLIIFGIFITIFGNLFVTASLETTNNSDLTTIAVQLIIGIMLIIIGIFLVFNSIIESYAVEDQIWSLLWFTRLRKLPIKNQANEETLLSKLRDLVNSKDWLSLHDEMNYQFFNEAYNGILKFTNEIAELKFLIDLFFSKINSGDENINSFGFPTLCVDSHYWKDKDKLDNSSMITGHTLTGFLTSRPKYVEINLIRLFFGLKFESKVQNLEYNVEKLHRIDFLIILFTRIFLHTIKHTDKIGNPEIKFSNISQPQLPIQPKLTSLDSVDSHVYTILFATVLLRSNSFDDMDNQIISKPIVTTLEAKTNIVSWNKINIEKKLLLKIKKSLDRDIQSHLSNLYRIIDKSPNNPDIEFNQITSLYEENQRFFNEAVVKNYDWQKTWDIPMASINEVLSFGSFRDLFKKLMTIRIPLIKQFYDNYSELTESICEAMTFAPFSKNFTRTFFDPNLIPNQIFDNYSFYEVNSHSRKLTQKDFMKLVDLIEINSKKIERINE